MAAAICNGLLKNVKPFFWCRDIVFTFGLQSGNDAGVAFECALEQTDSLDDGSGDQNSTALAYSACSSPVSYANLSDGAFSFYVRAQGEQLADSRAFFKVACLFKEPGSQPS